MSTLAAGAALTEGVITDAHQVACQRSADGLVLLTLQDARNTSRTVVANRLRKSCVGTLTFYACLINEVVIEVKAVITDLQEGELRTFTCLASMEGETGTETKVLGQVNVTKTGDDDDDDDDDRHLQNTHADTHIHTPLSIHTSVVKKKTNKNQQKNHEK